MMAPEIFPSQKDRVPTIIFQGQAVKLWGYSLLKVNFAHHLHLGYMYLHDWLIFMVFIGIYIYNMPHGSYGFCPLAKVSGERVGQETAAIVSCLLAARRLCDRESCEFLAEGKTSGENGSFSP